MTFSAFATFISTRALLALSGPLLHSPYILLEIACICKLIGVGGGGPGLVCLIQNVTIIPLYTMAI
jgi:hypothetical protein